MMNNQPTPLEKLIAEQRRVREICRVQEQKINEDFKYMHRHSGRLLLAGISSLFFSRHDDRKPREEQNVSPENQDMFGLGALWKAYSPLLWEAALPILLRWGMEQVGNLFKRRPKSEAAS